MFFMRRNFIKWTRRLALPMFLCAIIFAPTTAFARWEIVDSLNLAPFVPRVLDAFMMVARGGYEYFVGNGDGIIYLMIWGFLAISVFMYAFKMFFPKRWVEFLGLSGGGEIWDEKIKGMTIAETALKSAMRAIVAATFLLQIKPVYVTEWLVNPFLEFGAIYTDVILDTQNMSGIVRTDVTCPKGVLSGDWLNVRSCKFMIEPIADLSATNNQVVKRGFDFVARGLRGLLVPIPHGGQNIMDMITGILLIFTFVGCNLFMALMIIQGIFNFGMALILYPFNVLVWVAKPSDKWFDVIPAFSEILKALRALIITMISCAFILIVNVAVVRALFQFDSSVFVVSAGGAASSNLNGVNANAVGFGGHSLLWLSSLLTFFLMNAIFDRTREQLEKYAPGMTGLYKQAKDDFKANVDKAKGIYESAKKLIKLIK